MLNRCISLSLRNSFGLIVTRHLSLSTNLAQQPKQQQATDPIQQLFIDKIHEYFEKRKQTKDGLVDATPEVRKNLEETLNKLKNAYGAESEDLLSVPKLNFNEPQLESVIERHKKEITETEVKLSPKDIEKYSGPYGSWSSEGSANKQIGSTSHQQRS